MRDWQRGTFGVLLLGTAYLAVLSVLPPGWAAEAATTAQVASMGGAAWLILARARRHSGRAMRAWQAAAGSAAASALIFVVWFSYQVRGQPVPVPSPADVPFFAAVALVVLAVVLLPQSGAHRTAGPTLALDGLIVATSLLVISWRLIIGPTLDAVDGWSVQAAVLLAYPLADVAAATAALMIAARSRPSGRPALVFLILGILAFACGDTAYGMLSLAGTFHAAHPVTVLWLVGYPLMAVGARLPVDQATRQEESARATRIRVLVLMGPVVGALGLTAFQDVDDGSSVLTLGLVAMVLARQMMAMFTELELRSGLERRVLQQTEALRRQVFLDPVTGLGNRPLLRDRVAHQEQRAGETALLLLDLDGFKAVNDTLGHAAGDAVLVHVGARLGAVTRPDDTVVRLGGDEFAVLLPQTGQNGALRIAARVLEEIHRPLEIAGTEVEVSGSVGVAVGGRAFDADELLRQADLAMYEAKANGGQRASVYEPRMLHLLHDRVRGEQEIRTAVRLGQIVVYYQPLVDLSTGEVTGLEALARWDHPERGVVPPSEFIEASERTGTIVELGERVLREACAELRQWREDWPALTLAVNLSQRELLDPDLCTRLAEVLREHGLPPSALHLEVTETVIAADKDLAGALGGLAELGVGLSIDDFGTGHSSLSRLRALPIGRLKIDRSFVHEVADGGAPLLASVLALGRSLGLLTVAEGVETREQLEFLARHGCHEIQGYLVSRPVAAQHVVPLLFGTRLRVDTPDLPAPSTAGASLDRMVERVVSAPEASAGPIQAILEQLADHLQLESTYITTVSESEQVVRWAHNRGGLSVPVGLRVPWEETLCRRLLEDGEHVRGGLATSDRSVPAALRLGINSFMSIPIHTPDGALVGTLCGASRRDLGVSETELALVHLLAQVLGEPVAAVALEHSR